MASTTLKLVIEKGPRSGETLEYNQKSRVRVGRVVKGNNLPIKDSGISSKHLEIAFNSDSGKWVVTDLDSSNGTFLNSSQLKPLSPFEICDGDEIKLGELTSIRVQIVEIEVEISNRRNPRRQAALKIGTDLGGKFKEDSKLGKNVGIGEEIGSRRNPRRRIASESCTKLGAKVEEGSTLGENIEIREELNNGRNLRRQGASKRGHGLGNKVEVPEVDCLKLEENFSMVGDSEEEDNEKGVEDNRRGRGRGRLKKVSNLDDGYAGIGETVEMVKSMRITRSTKNAVDVMASAVESITVVENKKTRGGRGRKKKVEVGCSENVLDAVPEDKVDHEVSEKEVPEKVVDLSEQPCEEPVAGSGPNVLDDTKNEQFMPVEVPKQVVLGDGKTEELEEIDHEVSEEKVPEKVVDLSEQPCEEPFVGSEPILLGDTKKELLMPVEPSTEQERVQFVEEQHHAELMGTTNQLDDYVAMNANEHLVSSMDEPNQQERCISSNVSDEHCVELMVEPEQQDDCVALNVSDEHCVKLMDESNQQDNCVAMNLNDQRRVELMDESIQQNFFVVGPSLVEKGGCDGVERKAVSDGGESNAVHSAGKTEELEEVDKWSEINFSGASKDQGATNVPDFEKMTLGDWFNFLEVYLPKKIYAATDEIVGDMKKRAIQFEDFMLQQQNEKRKLF